MEDVSDADYLRSLFNTKDNPMRFEEKLEGEPRRFRCNDDLVPSLERDSMLAGELLQQGAQGPSFAPFCLLEPTADPSNRLQKLLAIEKFLVGLQTLDDNLGLAIDGEHSRFAGLLQPANIILGVSLELAQRVNVAQVHNS